MRVGSGHRTAIVAMGLIAPRVPADQFRAAWLAVPPDERAAIAHRNSCILRTADNARRHGLPLEGTVPSGQPFVEYAERVERRVRALEATADHVDLLCRQLGVQGWAIKGAAMQPLYAEPRLRDIGDLDVLVPSSSAAFDLAAKLRHSGYEYAARELPWLKFDPSTACFYGQLNLRNPGDPSLVSVDLHFGGYSVRHSALFREVPDRATAGLSMPPLWIRLVHLVANSAGDCAIRAKDLNDLTLLLERSELEWSAAADALRELGLLPFFRSMLKRLRRQVRLPSLADRRAHEVRNGMREPLPRDGQISKPRRRLITTGHAFAQGCRNGEGRALRQAFDAWWYYGAELEIHDSVSPTARRPIVFSRDTCIRLVPIAHVCASEATPAASYAVVPDSEPNAPVFETHRGELVVRAAGEYFVPTVDYSIDRQRIRSVFAIG